ncbi:MAG TPA: HNH endonuclease signature motif containing protein [Candidatus Acidoferrales bacterium]|nr:HNH endonuclease signature motif containing protein [Candidatus Acidoferrales bacterium]
MALDRATTADLLAHLAEVDARKLYLPAGYPSMYAWCVGELGCSEEAAYRRIHAARTAASFPGILPAIATGELSLTAVGLLAPHLTPDNAAGLLAAAARKPKRELERLLAERFPQPDLPTLVQPIAPSSTLLAFPQRHDAEQTAVAVQSHETKLGPDRVEAAAVCARVAPLSPQRFALQVTLAQATHDKLRRAQELLGHAVAPGDVAQVLDRALELLVAQLERRKCGACTRPRQGEARTNASAGAGQGRAGRHIPAHVRRHVWQRDGGRCSFVGESGHRCEERSRLEFDHVEPVARGGQTTVANLRLRCRAHNQFAAERAFGKGFMDAKRRSSQGVIDAEEVALHGDVISSLRNLGCSIDQARRIAERPEVRCAGSLDARILRAVQQLGPPSARRIPPA